MKICERCLQVTMVDRSAAERICKDPNPIIDGRKANVNLAYLGAKPRIQATELLGTNLISEKLSTECGRDGRHVMQSRPACVSVCLNSKF